MFDQLTTALKLTALAASVGVAGSSMAAITVLHSYDLEGALGGTAANSESDDVGSLDLTLNGTGSTTPTYVSSASASTGVDFANAGGNLSQFANNYYENTAGTITLADTTNWGVEAYVTLNNLPNTTGDTNGESSLMEIGTGGNRVILQTFKQSGTQVWMIHVAGLALFAGAPTGGGALVAGQEQHIAAVYNGGTWELYIDGSSVALETIYNSGTTGLSASPTGLRLAGAENGGNIVRGLDGQIAAARIFEFNAGEFNINDTLVPEPGSLALLGLGGLMIVRRRRA